jgi:UDP-3-O-[3-hydroxymyristoyl] glucosamine N-acyltransferase
MPDPRFYRRAGPFTLGDLALRCDAVVAEGCDPDALVRDVATVEVAGPNEIIYISDSAYLDAFAASKCGACVTTKAYAAKAPQKCAVLLADEPRLSFAQIALIFYPSKPVSDRKRNDFISPDAILGTDVHVEPGAVIGPRAEIGNGVCVGAGAVVGSGVVLGEGCEVGANTTVTHALIGTNVKVAAGSQIGQEGFGFVPTKAGFKKIPQLGRVIIEDNVEIGANCTVDRGALGDTTIGAGTKIDNLVQIAHNVEIGRNCIIVSQVGISGSCRIGDGVVIGGQGGLANHVNIGDGAQIAAKSGIMRDIGAGDAVMGYPAKPIRQFWREVAALSRLTKRGK